MNTEHSEHWLGLDWTTVTTDKLADMAAIVEQKQQRVAVGPGNVHFHFCSSGVVPHSSDVATMQRGTCGHAVYWHTHRC